MFTQLNNATTYKPHPAQMIATTVNQGLPTYAYCLNSW